MKNTQLINSKKIHKKQAAAMLLALALIITGLFAFLTAADSKTNVFTVGNIDIELWENFDTDKSGAVTDGEDNTPNEIYDASNKQPPTVSNVLPGDTIIKQPFIKNTGANEAWVFMTVAIPTAPLTNLVYNSSTGSVEITGSTSQIEIKAYGIQKGYGGNDNDTATLRWTALGIDIDGNTHNAVADSSSRAPLFSMIDIDTSKWTQIGNVYHSDDGNDYYVFAYNNILPAVDNEETENTVENVTSNLFDKVKLLEGIGASSINNITFINNGRMVDIVNYSNETDNITAPAVQSVKWIAPNGRIFTPNSTHEASQYLSYQANKDGSIGVVDPNPIVESLSTSTVIPKLLPKQGSTIAIERNGTVETYNNYTDNPYNVTTVLAPNSTKYTPGDKGFSNYFIYGLNGTEYSTVPETDYPLASSPEMIYDIFNDFLEVNVNETVMSLSDFNNSEYGHVEIEIKDRGARAVPQFRYYTGTGFCITVYNNDNNVVERFYLITSGDINSDGYITNDDVARLRSVIKGYTNERINERMTAYVKACDLDHDGMLTNSDIEILSMVGIGVYIINDTNQTYWEY